MKKGWARARDLSKVTQRLRYSHHSRFAVSVQGKERINRRKAGLRSLNVHLYKLSATPPPHSHFTAAATKAQRGSETCLRSHSSMESGVRTRTWATTPSLILHKPGPGEQSHSPTAPEPLPSSSRDSEGRTLPRSPAPLLDAPPTPPQPLRLPCPSSRFLPARPGHSVLT